MPGGVEFMRVKPTEGLGLLEPEPEIIRVLFPNPKAALLVDPDLNLWSPWGRRGEQPGDWPDGGWAREESLEKAYWTRWKPEPFVLRAHRWMEKDHAKRSHWCEVPGGEGILCLRLKAAPGEPAYMVTQASFGDYAEIHPRMPKLLPLR